MLSVSAGRFCGQTCRSNHTSLLMDCLLDRLRHWKFGILASIRRKGLLVRAKCASQHTTDISSDSGDSVWPTAPMHVYPEAPICHCLTDCPVQKLRNPSFLEKMEDLVLCDKSSVFGATDLQLCKTVHVLLEIFERLGGVAAQPQAKTARMKRYLQDATTDPSVELPLTKLQYTAFMKKGVPRLRKKAAVTRHILPVLLKMIEIHFSRPPSLPVPSMSLPHVR